MSQVVHAEDEERLNPEDVTDECDFVELGDGKLLVIWRYDVPRQLTLQRDSEGSTYTCFKDKGAGPGGLALFTNKSTGAFRNVRFDTKAREIRSKWRLSLDERWTKD